MTANGTRYRTMIMGYLLPKIEALNFDDIWFQQGDATQIAKLCEYLLRERFDEFYVSER